MNDNNVTTLTIIDKYGNPVGGRYKLKTGENIFKCIATFADSTKTEFNAYWTCPIILRNVYTCEVDNWGVLGRDRKNSVTINASPAHEKYTELNCWVSPHESNVNLPHAVIGFDYTNVV